MYSKMGEMYVVNVDKGREFKSMHGAYERDGREGGMH